MHPAHKSVCRLGREPDGLAASLPQNLGAARRALFGPAAAGNNRRPLGVPLNCLPVKNGEYWFQIQDLGNSRTETSGAFAAQP